TDADGYTTEYTYNALDLVRSINYNGNKKAVYRYIHIKGRIEILPLSTCRYNATGNLTAMMKLLSIATFKVREICCSSRTSPDITRKM
ncbi:MAG: hypothetical protein RRY06_08520, partial [Lachnospiraceae bacterium]